jgi:hypothetical protein
VPVPVGRVVAGRPVAPVAPAAPAPAPAADAALDDGPPPVGGTPAVEEDPAGDPLGRFVGGRVPGRWRRRFALLT